MIYQVLHYQVGTLPSLANYPIQGKKHNKQYYSTGLMFNMVHDRSIIRLDLKMTSRQQVHLKNTKETPTLPKDMGLQGCTIFSHFGTKTSIVGTC